MGATLFYALTGTSPLSCDLSLGRPELLDKVRTSPRRTTRSANSHVSRVLANMVDESLSLSVKRRPALQEVENKLGKIVRKQQSRWKLTMVFALALGCLWITWTSVGTSRNPSQPSSSGLFSDMFWDKTTSRWECHDMTGGLGQFDASDRTFHIHTVGPPRGYVSGLLAVAIGTDKPEYANGIYTMKMSVDTMSTAAGGLFRWNEETHSGYYMELLRGHDEKLNIALASVFDWDFILVERKDFHFQPKEDFLLRADFNGPDISITVWPDNHPMPTPQIVVSNSDHASGMLSLWVAQGPFTKLGRFGATFDDVHFEVRQKQE